MQEIHMQQPFSDIAFLYNEPHHEKIPCFISFLLFKT